MLARQCACKISPATAPKLAFELQAPSVMSRPMGNRRACRVWRCSSHVGRMASCGSRRWCCPNSKPYLHGAQAGVPCLEVFIARGADGELRQQASVLRPTAVKSPAKMSSSTDVEEALAAGALRFPGRLSLYTGGDASCPGLEVWKQATQFQACVQIVLVGTGVQASAQAHTNVASSLMHH